MKKLPDEAAPCPACYSSTEESRPDCVQCAPSPYLKETKTYKYCKYCKAYTTLKEILYGGWVQDDSDYFTVRHIGPKSEFFYWECFGTGSDGRYCRRIHKLNDSQDLPVKKRNLVWMMPD